MAVITKNQRGMALILTITLIGLIVILTLQFSKSIRAGLYETDNFDDGIRLGTIAKSGFNCAMAVLYEDDPKVDSFLDDWAKGEEYSALSPELFDNEGAFQAQVTDLSGKIQINNLIYTRGAKKGEFNPKQKDILKRFLGNPPFSLGSEEIENILDAMKDWMDEDDIVEGLGGAEDSYYESLNNPYLCRNAPFQSLNELLLVRGITPELFYGTADTPGISAYLTVYGDGKININTADPKVLQALSSEELDSDMADEMVEYRKDSKNDLSSPDWWKKALTTSEPYFDASLITVKSSYFEITSKSAKDSNIKGVTGVLRRQGKTLTVLSWMMF